MNNLKMLFASLMITVAIFSIGCKDEEPLIEEVTLTSIATTGIDTLSGNRIPLDLTNILLVENVAEDAKFTINFSKIVDPQSAMDNVVLSGEEILPSTINITGSEVVITPIFNLDTGLVYSLSILAGLKAEDNGKFVATARFFRILN